MHASFHALGPVMFTVEENCTALLKVWTVDVSFTILPMLAIGEPETVTAPQPDANVIVPMEKSSTDGS